MEHISPLNVFPHGTYFPMELISSWNIFPHGTYFPVERISPWNVFPHGTYFPIQFFRYGSKMCHKIGLAWLIAVNDSRVACSEGLCTPELEYNFVLLRWLRKVIKRAVSSRDLVSSAVACVHITWHILFLFLSAPRAACSA
jgi:hypothetical protein